VTIRRIEVSHPSGVFRRNESRDIRPVESRVWQAPQARITAESAMTWPGGGVVCAPAGAGPDAIAIRATNESLVRRRRLDDEGNA
jgi:hypothetical protein